VTSKSKQIDLRWRHHRSDVLGIELDVLDGPPPSEGEAGGIRYLIQETGGVKLGVWSGPGRGLASWREAYGARRGPLGAESTIQVCGVAARRQEAPVAAESATGAYVADGQIEHIQSDQPAVVSVAAAFEVAGRPFLAEFAVPAADRDGYRDAEKRFFAGLSCP